VELAPFLRQFTDARVVELRDVVNQDGEYFLLAPGLRELHRAIGRKAVYYGTYLGRALIDRFVPSLFLLDLLAAAPGVRRAVVTPKAEWLFVTGKNVLASSVTRTMGTPEPGVPLIALNDRGEALGYGTVDRDPTREERYIIRRRFDIGDFLRRERRPARGARR
jgi:ribosome biogenesis protein Nip4